MGSSAEPANPPSKIEVQMPDAPGRLGRAVPLFLAEQTYFSTHANVQAWIPWIAEEQQQGFVLAGVPWTDETAADYAKRFVSACDYVVVSHLRALSDSWEAELRSFDRATERTWHGRRRHSTPPIPAKRCLNWLAAC